MSENISKLSGRQSKGLKKNLFQQITDIGKQGRIPTKEDMESISGEYNVGKATIYGSSTFYEFLTDEHLSKKAYVCNGSACLCAGTQQTVTQALGKQFDSENVGHITCLGRCHEAGAFQINGINYSGDAINNLEAIQQQALTDSPVTGADHYNVSCNASETILTGDDLSTIDSFRAALEKALSTHPEALLETIKTSGLRGRGGAGFPTGIKWESCRNVPGDEKYVVCNADEGDPGAYSDRYLLEQQIWRVLLGMVTCGLIVGAEQGALYIRAEYPESIEVTNQAIRALNEQGLLGDNILGTAFNFQLSVIEGAGAYICGEETALLASIEGRRAEVDVRPPFPTVEGLFKKPTVVNNVESFAAIPAILEIGGEKYAAMGNGRSTGTKLISLDSGFNTPGIYEVEMGTPLATVINELGGGFIQPTKALHIGGPLGGLVPMDSIDSLSVDFESFASSGFLLGHASVVCIPENMPIIDYIEHLFEFTAAESCGKCFPCRLGSTRGKEMMQNAISGTKKLDRELLGDLLDTMQQGSLCALGGGLPLPIKNALSYFEDELAPYFTSKIAITEVN